MSDIEQLQIAIDEVVEYNWEKELEDFRENEESRPAHIFRHLVTLNNFVTGTKATPESYIDTGMVCICGAPIPTTETHCGECGG